ncbi:dermonecrotic toxin domain-containing protein [Pseudomonas sp. Marseille-P9899]|uniref:dermonecrotic toxin domain-containing protein n=1 Tax=Pseudomonas sp. Marseille-P9899 TaxID=2730401 RepID=UPI00158952F8|nr:DUF6543 domain-containing protein [Pseudomonas sp. Marseille-P9899]
MPQIPHTVSPAADFHQQVIKERLPAWTQRLSAEQINRLEYLSNDSEQPWLLNALPALREEFEQLQRRLHASTFDLAKAMQGLKLITDFATPLLEDRLHRVFDLQADLSRLKLVRFSRDWNWMLMQAELNHVVEPLLQAALQNFPKDFEWQPESVAIDGDFVVGSHLGYPRYHYKGLPFTAQQFAQECHVLDLGQRYQQHLDGVLGRTQVRDLGIEVRKLQFHRDLLVARICYNLRDDCDPVLSLIAENTASPHSPRCQRLNLFDIDILDAVLIYPARDSEAVMLYLPGVEDGALTRYPTLGACQRDLVRRLCQPAFRQRFMRFIQHDNAPHFASVLQRNLTGQTLPADRDSVWQAAADTDLRWSENGIDGELFGYLQDRHHRRLLNEARQLAVPSADADEAARQQRLHDWESRGLNLLGVAAFFIPAAGQLMTLVFVAQVLDTVYEGVKSWRHGDIDAALASVKAVALDGVMAVGGGVAFHYANTFTGKWLEVMRPDGTPRLWNADLTPYQVPAPPTDIPLDPLGKRVVDANHLLPLDDAHYQIAPHADGQRWQIVHPDDPYAFRPIVEHNDQGAWLAAHESPLDWSRRTLLRRIGHQVEAYSDQELEIASRVSGISRDELLDIYLRRAPAPTRLIDTAQRLRGDVPAEDRLDAALEGLYLPRRRCTASDRLTLWSLPRESAWPANTRLELRNGGPSGPLLERAGERQAGDLRLIVKTADGYRPVLNDQPLAVTEDLFAALAQVMPEFSGDAEALKARIAEHALADRESTQRWLWSGHDYGWTDDGRLFGGTDRPDVYPLPSTSGNLLITRYRRLYPRASDASAEIQLDQWRASARPPHLELRALERQLEYLRTTLGQWADNRPARTRIRDALLDNWQRQTAIPSVLDLSALNLVDTDFTDFPHLAEGFAHVSELSLDSNELQGIPVLLTRQLPGLRCLWAASMRLRHMPEGLGPRLTTLEMTDNQITWSPASQAALEQCTSLQVLNLAGNPLETPPDITRLLAMRDLGLFDTDLHEFPAGLDLADNLEHLEMGANQIADLPEPLGMSEAAQLALSLEQNQLSAATVERIEAHFRETGIDLMVSAADYEELLLGASTQIMACWERVSRLMPLQYRRDLRELVGSNVFQTAPTTTRRRIWVMLRWLETPRAMESATSVDARSLLSFELAADLCEEVAFPGLQLTPRQQTEHVLSVAVGAIRYLAVNDALRLRFPIITELEFEIFRARTLQRVSVDMPMRLAPTPIEIVYTRLAGGRLESLDANWTTQLHEQLRELDPSTMAGRAALLAERPDGEYAYAFWVSHLRRRYAADFEQLQEQADTLLETAEREMNEGDYVVEANRLRLQFEADQRRLLDDLTRAIADGTQTRW